MKAPLELNPNKLRLPHGDIEADWLKVIAAKRGQGSILGPFAPLFQPFLNKTGFVIAQLGQSLDGRIATPTGDSKYINGQGGLTHLHRVRAMVDAVVIGVSTAMADNPGLDVRHVQGDNPARVVIDPNGRVDPDLRLFRRDGARRILVTGGVHPNGLDPDIEIVTVAPSAGGLSPRAIIAALSRIGLKRLLIEGGAQTVSRFVAAGALDRLHVIVAPFLIGAGPSGLTLPDTRTLADGIRPPTKIYSLGEDVLFDCDLSGRR